MQKDKLRNSKYKKKIANKTAWDCSILMSMASHILLRQVLKLRYMVPKLFLADHLSFTRRTRELPGESLVPLWNDYSVDLNYTFVN